MLYVESLVLGEPLYNFELGKKFWGETSKHGKGKQKQANGIISN